MINIFVLVSEDEKSGGWTAMGYELKGLPGRYELNHEHRCTVRGKTHTYYIASDDFLLDYNFAKSIALKFHMSAVRIMLNER